MRELRGSRKVVGPVQGGGAGASQAWIGGERALSGPGALRVNMRWDLVARPVGATRPPQFDVDLGALYELADGTSGAVQYLGGLRGAFDRSPFIAHDQDDRAGSAAGENLFVNLDRGTQLRRALVFVYAHNGPLANGRIMVEFHPPGGSRPLMVVLEHIPPEAHSCAVALLVRHEGQWNLRHEVRYMAGYQSEIDRAYGFRLRWARQDKFGL